MLDTAAAPVRLRDETLDSFTRARDVRSSRPASPLAVEAAHRLEDAVQRRRAFALLAGPPGSGKSTLLRNLAAELRRRAVTTVRVDGAGCSGRDLLAQCSDALGLGCDPSSTAEALWWPFSDAVRGRLAADAPLVLIVDHADRMDADAVRLLERLLHAMHQAGLTVIAAARQPAPGALAELARNHADVCIPLDALSRAETEQFVRGRLDAVDANPERMTSEACEELHALSAGELRQLARLSRLAALAAEAEAAERIDRRLVQSVAAELPQRDAAQIM